MQYAEMEEVYRRWCREATEDTDVALELKQMEQDPEKIEDAFYRSLSFGTGGLRGLIGAGTNRMNLYTVAQATQGAADYICAFFPKEKRRVAVSYDSRIKSRLFAETAAQVLAANGVEVKLFSRLMPTPCLSFAVRRLSCCLGIMITSSHNPARYNGYKVYGADGCQITSQAAGEIFKRIGRLDVFRDVKRLEFEEAVKGKLVSYVGEDTVTAYVEAVKAQSLLAEQTPARRDMTIVYTPLNGTGLEPVTRVLKEKGYSDVHLVKEQEQPDGTFPTCPYPNPEVPESMDLGIALAERLGGELLLATDPDCDRVGIAVKDGEGGYRRLSANETGLLLLDYVCSRRQDLGTMPAHPVMAKTIVDEIAQTASGYIGSIMEMVPPKIVEEGQVPEYQSSPSVKRNAALGGIVGAVLVCGVLTLLVILNDTIRTEEDVERYLGLTTLALVPERGKSRKGEGRKQRSGDAPTGERKKGASRSETNTRGKRSRQ